MKFWKLKTPCLEYIEDWAHKLRGEMAKKETVKNAEKLVEMGMKGNDASHDEAHVWRVRDLALSLAREEGLASNPESMEIVNIYFFVFCFFF